METRTISKITQNPFQPGFLGAGHSASSVMDGVPYPETDPFILFMDDRLNLPGGEPFGGAHPHAGFETLTLILKGNDEHFETGSFELMTAGKGIEHTEEISGPQNIHILQVWLALPPDKRWVQPRWQKILLADTPTIKHEGFEIRVYSGSSNGLTSPIQNYTPLTLVEFRMSEYQNVVQQIPANYTGLVYVLEGGLQIGDQTIAAGQAGWLNKTHAAGDSKFTLQTFGESAHFVLYAAQPHNAPIVQYGPFVADTKEEIAQLYKAYRNGEMPHLNDLDEKYKYMPPSPKGEHISLA